MMDKLAELIWKILEPRLEDVIQTAYVKGGEDVIRRFAFVYEKVADTAKADAYAEAGAISIEELDEELSQTIFEELN